MCFILLLSHLLQSGGEPGLSLSESGPVLSLACQDVGEPDKLVFVE